MPSRRSAIERADSSTPARSLSLFEARTEALDEGEADVRVAAPEESRTSLTKLRTTAAHCRACPLWRYATQTVFGEGAVHAPLFVVGEQPGHSEDLQGQPFVGPAGRLLEQAFAAAGVERRQLYVTNAVKHFKWELRGKRRLHKTPTQKEVDACHPWLEAELEQVNPRAVLCLGATAARAVIGASVRIADYRGQTLKTAAGLQAVVTVHPAYVLRLKGGAAEEAYAMLQQDVVRAARLARI